MWERIRLARTYAQLTQEQLGEDVGVSKSAVAQWETKDPAKRTQPTLDNLKAISARTGAPVSWLMDDQVEIDPHWRERLKSMESREVGNVVAFSRPPGAAPRAVAEPPSEYAVPVPAGRLIPVVGHAKLGDNAHFVELEYPAGHGDGYIDMPSNDPNAYALRCDGDSMTPRIKHGEFVVIEPNRTIAAGDEVLVKAIDGRVMVKEFLYRREGRVHLLSVNEEHRPIVLEQSQVEAMHFVAAIVKTARWVQP
jgi:phage repressor protein C with HTH and peptisase S24 domain